MTSEPATSVIEDALATPLAEWARTLGIRYPESAKQRAEIRVGIQYELSQLSPVEQSSRDLVYHLVGEAFRNVSAKPLYYTTLFDMEHRLSRTQASPRHFTFHGSGTLRKARQLVMDSIRMRGRASGRKHV